MYVHYPHYIWSILICSQLLSFGSRRSRYVEVLITGKDVVSLLMGIPRKTLTSLKKLKNDEKWMIKPLTHWQFPSPKTCLKIEESCETKAVKPSSVLDNSRWSIHFWRSILPNMLHPEFICMISFRRRHDPSLCGSGTAESKCLGRGDWMF